MMITPSGRFAPSTRLCLTMSDFHRISQTTLVNLNVSVAECWNPAWSVASILTGLLSFMLEATSTTGSVSTTDAEKQLLATQSRQWNRERNPKFTGIILTSISSLLSD
jgi:ubiquitin-conjugating enzyme E2 J2